MKFKDLTKSLKSKSGQSSEKSNENAGGKGQRFSLMSKRDRKKALKRTPPAPTKLSYIDYEVLAIDVKEVCKEVKESLNELLLDFEEYKFYSDEIMGHCETLQDNAEKITIQLDGRQEDERVLFFEKEENSNPPNDETRDQIGDIAEEEEPE